jgi:predicted Rdx family selenoprotein
LEVAQENANNVVQFLDSDANTITGLIIGKRSDSGGSYVRLVSSDDVYLCENTPWIRSSAIDYIDRELISAKHDNIIKVTVTDANGGTYTLESEPNSSDVKLATPLPEGKKLKADYKSVFSALTSLRFDDVMKRESAPADLAFKRTYICNLKDSTSYILKLAKTGEKTYATISAIFADTEKVVIDRSKKESEEELKKKEAKLLAHEAVDKLNAKCEGWIYEIPSWKANNLTKSLDDIIEDIKPAEETAEDSEE